MPKLLVAAFLLLFAAEARAQSGRHNVLLFVADGLRPSMVNETTAPTMVSLWKRGVRFSNTYSMFPTFTTANAASMATGHKIGDTGDFSNVIYTGFKVPGAGDSVTPFLENDPVLGDVDAHFAGDYLHQETVMRAARLAGLSTATIGKLGPALIFDHSDRSANGTIVLDDQTGRGGIPLSDEVQKRMAEVGLPLQAPTRGENAKAGDFKTAGTLQANVEQQAYFLNAATKVMLPLFKARTKPFMMVYWSRDPDGTQHNQGDSLNVLTPGINGPTSLASIRNADDNLAGLLATLKELGLDQTTDVIITSDHGFSTISKESGTSFAASQSYGDVVPKLLPSGFVAIDIAHGLQTKLFDPDAKGTPVVADGTHPFRGNGLIGGDPDHPRVVVAANGGSDLIYLPDGDPALARDVTDILAKQDYVSGLFVSDSFGFIPGTLPIAAIDLKGSAVTPMPAIVVNFRSYPLGCAEPETCTVEVADTGLQQGQGMHGSFSRADTNIIGGAIGPDFRAGWTDPAPTSNADIGKTMAQLLGLDVPNVGQLTGRVISEAMPGGTVPEWRNERQVSPQADAGGRVTAVEGFAVRSTRYFKAAGYPGRTQGLPERPTN
jgi:arylsulfatase A-like enzyme